MDNSPGDMELKLARALANPEKAVRDKTILTLHNYLGSTDFDDLEMMRLWKSLYFCLWLADKQDVQLELANNLAKLLHSCKSEEQLYQFTSCFYRTIMREWGKLDYYRVNKFYSLIRVFLRETFAFLQKNKWDSELTMISLSILTAEVLEKKPNGPRLHVADIYLDELKKVTGSSGDSKDSEVKDKSKKNKKSKSKAIAADDGMNTSVFMNLYKPWFTILIQETDRSFRERVNSNLFTRYLELYARENEGEVADDNIPPLFQGVNTQALQAQIFSLASIPDEEWGEQVSYSNNSGNSSNGKRKWDPSGTITPILRTELYDLHHAFQAKTDVQFVDAEDIEAELADGAQGLGGGNASFGGALGGESTPSNPKKKSKKNAEEGEAVSTPKSSSKASKKEKKNAEEKEKESENENGSGKKSKKSKKDVDVEVEVEVERDETPSKSAKKQKREKEREEREKKESNNKDAASTPTEKDGEKKEKEKEPFVSAKKFSGARPGYVFKKDKKGLGYYVDSVEQVKQRKVAKKEEKASLKEKGSGKKEKVSRNASVKDIPRDSPDKKGVHFGNQIEYKKDYDKSVYALKTTTSPELARKVTPSKGALKKTKK